MMSVRITKNNVPAQMFQGHIAFSSKPALRSELPQSTSDPGALNLLESRFSCLLQKLKGGNIAGLDPMAAPSRITFPL